MSEISRTPAPIASRATVATGTPEGFAQPQTSKNYRLLHSGWVCEGIALDVYGTADEDGAEVCAIAQMGSRVDLTDVLAPSVIDKAQHHINEQGARELAASILDARIERAQWQRAA